MAEQAKSEDSGKGLPDTLNLEAYPSVLTIFNESCAKYATKPAFSNLGLTLTYQEVDELSSAFAAFLQHKTSLNAGDRIAIQLPNVLQFPIAAFGALKAGMVIVNTNPMYTARELEHQFKDSGAKALVTLANFASVIQEVLPRTPIETVIISELGDMLNPFKRTLVNGVVKYVKKMVPAFDIPGAISFRQALKQGQSLSFKTPANEPSDVAVLQYTGGTTGVAKGAMLTHRNLVANMFQIQKSMPILRTGQEVAIAPLPLYHIYAFNIHCMAMMELGNHSVLITNPRDMPGFIKELKSTPFTVFVGLNTLFNGLCNQPEFANVDFAGLRLTIAGGMALQKSVADRWEQITGCKIVEGYGMTETSPVVSVNPYENIQIGTIGLPVEMTEVRMIDEDGKVVPDGESGELCVRGPQVMKGYWQREEATAETISEDGWLKTGDVGVRMPDGFLKIVDRIKDMILVSGFNVYPNELEDALSESPKVIECAAVGIPDEKSGEAVKMFVVRSDESLTEEGVKAFCKERLTGYKVPKSVEFRDELPKTNVGKILRRSLRDEGAASA